MTINTFNLDLIQSIFWISQKQNKLLLTSAFLFLPIECCCRTNKDPLVTMESNISTVSGNNYMGNQTESTLPPNYDELDPPPSYSVLFPRNKAESSSSATDVSLLSSAATASSLSSLPSSLPISSDDYRSIPSTPSDSVLPNQYPHTECNYKY